MVTAIQSGSPRILKMMNRLYDAKKIAEIGYDFKKINPSFDFRTEIIIGFPSETMEDFLQTLNLIKKAKFDSVTIYLYIDRPEAPAYNFLDKISELEKIKRANLAKVILNRYKIKYYYD
jgi:tRNA A37 methylthiotransferase MiaB